MTIGTPALVGLIGAAMCAGGVLVVGAMAVWLIRNNPMR